MPSLFQRGTKSIEKLGHSITRASNRIQWIVVILGLVVIVLLVLSAIVVTPGSSWEPRLRGLSTHWAVSLSGAALGLVSYFFISALKNDVTLLKESIQTRLESFEEIYRSAYRLLTWVGSGEDTEFWITSASPIFGIELPERDQEQWMAAIEERARNNRKTVLLCYDWESDEGHHRSPLGRFSSALQGRSSDANRRVAEFIVKSWVTFDHLWKFIDANRTIDRGSLFEVKLIQEPAFGIVYAKKGHESEAVIYLSNSESNQRSDVRASGYRTTDPNWIKLLRRTLEGLQQSARAIDFRRDDAYLERDRELYRTFVDVGVTGGAVAMPVAKKTGGEVEEWTLQVEPGVFPPERSLDTHAIADVVIRIGNRFSAARADILEAFSSECGPPARYLVGVDVGSGTGFLALRLAAFCDAVMATDNYKPAVTNTLRNLMLASQRADLFPALQTLSKEQFPDPLTYLDDRQVIDTWGVYHCNLMESVVRPSDNASLLVVFNFPAYPSPSNVFNCGGRKGGAQILEDMLAANGRRLRTSDMLIVPETIITQRVAMGVYVSDVAARQGYHAIQLDERERSLPVDGRPYRQTIRVFALIKKATKREKTQDNRLARWVATLPGTTTAAVQDAR